MKLGVCCVYFYGPDSGWILDLQLRYIASTLEGYDYTIYAAANRLQPELQRILQATPHVRIISLPEYEGGARVNEGSFEHAFYLDLLFREAANDGCTHLAAVDADSFPVLPDWPNVLLRRMGGKRFAGVLRSEDLDTHLPHPSGLFMDRSFFLEHAPRFFPPRDEMLADPSFREFLQETGQRTDTGIGYGYALWKSKEPWLPLMRSNQRNPHYLMAGIYGDIFFHVGSFSRRPWFYLDSQKRLSLRIKPTLAKIPVLWRLGSWIEDRYVASNSRTLAEISGSLRSDPDRFLANLRGL